MTVVIDDPERGGSDPGSWADAIAHTPALRTHLDTGPDDVPDDVDPITDADIPY